MTNNSIMSDSMINTKTSYIPTGNNNKKKCNSWLVDLQV